MGSYMIPDLVMGLDAEQVMNETQLTATKTDIPVIDLDAFGREGHPVVGECLIAISVIAAATADPTNLFTFKLFESDAKDDDTTLTNGTEVAAESLIGLPPVINATGAQTNFLLVSYRGSKKKIQVQPTETGTADVTVSIAAWAVPQVMEPGGKITQAS